jgi:hypothetical protein
MTTTQNITDDLMRLVDGVMAYRICRDHYVKMNSDRSIAIRRMRAGDMFADTTKANLAVHNAWHDLYLNRCALEDEGIKWTQIDEHDGFTYSDSDR